MSEDLFAKQVPFLRPWLGDEEADAVRDVIKSGWICLGPKVAEFEKRIAARVGSHGVATCYSFHPRKMITTGEGGMMMTDDDAIAERARQLRSTGASISDLVRHQAKGALFQQYFDAGYNYRMTDMQGAMGLV